MEASRNPFVVQVFGFRGSPFLFKIASLPPAFRVPLVAKSSIFKITPFYELMIQHNYS